MRLTEFLNQRSKAFTIITGLLLVIILGFVDYLTKDISFLVFDLIPVFFVTWFAGRSSGFLLCFASTISWIIVDMFERGSFSFLLVHYWNTAVKFGYFALVAYFISNFKKSLEREKELARIDHLTGILNGRVFLEVARIEKERSLRYKHPLTLAYMDIDEFKNINDTFGHSIGDSLLRLVAETIKNNIRTMDVVARLGGDEFVILLPETGSESAKIVFPRIKEVLSLVMHKNGWPVKFSFGVVTFVDFSGSVDEMLKKADNLIYSAKNSGRDTIKFGQSENSSSSLGPNSG